MCAIDLLSMTNNLFDQRALARHHYPKIVPAC